MKYPVPLLLSFVAVPIFAGAQQPSFDLQTVDASISIGYGLAIGDLDGDSRDDILLADKREIVWYQNPSWRKTTIAKNLSLRDNVCIAARDIDGDGRVEIAVGSNWNPGETLDTSASGAVYFLARPSGGTGRWDPISLPHDPTVHRMHWIKRAGGQFALAVLPLHGIGNQKGEGERTVELSLHDVPEDPTDAGAWQHAKIDTGLHKAHNFDLSISDGPDTVAVAGAQGVWQFPAGPLLTNESAGEVRSSGNLLATIEPMHGNRLAVLAKSGRTVIDDSLDQGHALAIGDLTGDGRPEIVAGWRGKSNSGIALYAQAEAELGWSKQILTDGVACEDLKLADLDGDGDLDIVAAGRATENVVILWNR